jgi:two-component system OmpR family sensor kinase
LSLSRRLILFTLSIIFLITSVLGIALVESNFRSENSRVLSAIETIANSISTSPDTSISSAVSLASESQNLISIYLYEDSGNILPILEGFEVDENSILSTFAKLQLESDSILSAESYRVRFVNLEDGDYIALLADISQFQDERLRNYLQLFIFILISTLLSLIVLRWIISRDIERAMAEVNELNRLQAESKKNQLLRNFIADASHELRTPLTVIKGYLDLHKQTLSSNSNSDLYAVLNTEANRIDRNISNLLTFLEQETVESEELYQIDLSNLLRIEISDFAKRERDKEVISRVQDGLRVLATEDLLLRMIRNALANISRHATPTAKVEISATAIGNTLTLRFENDSETDSLQDLKFEDLLKRFSHARSYEKGGSGLGINIMNSAAEKIGGNIKIYRPSAKKFGLEIELPIN